jgi:hypothetical protein
MNGRCDIDLIISEVRKAMPAVIVTQMHRTHPADDDGLWWFRPPGVKGNIQLESSTSNFPFLVEHDGMRSSSEALTIHTVPDAVFSVVFYLRSVSAGHAWWKSWRLWLCCAFGVATIWLVNRDFSLCGRLLLSRYGLNVDWSYGATTTVPSATVTFQWKGQAMECPFYLGGIEDPDLRFYDVNGDGTPDIVFGTSEEKIVVIFDPPKGEKPPRFKLEQDDTGRWPQDVGHWEDGRPLKK